MIRRQPMPVGTPDWIVAEHGAGRPAHPPAPTPRRLARLTRGDDALGTDPAEVPTLPPIPESVPVELSHADYALLHRLAMRSAAKGRYLTTGLPSPARVEDDESAVDAIGMAWAWASARGLASIPVRLVRGIARRRGARRAQHALSERTGLVECTDRVWPAEAVGMSPSQLVAHASPSLVAMATAKVEAWRKGQRIGRPLSRDPSPRTARRHRQKMAQNGQKSTPPV